MAICEQLEDKQKVVEKVTPNTDENNQPKQEPIKPEKKMNTKSAIKEINCNLSVEQLRELGEPDAYFCVTIPKECKTWNKQTDDVPTRATSSICIEPENGKIIVTNTRILHSIDVECSGIWPSDEYGKPFQCFIDPAAIRELAGKQTDIAVWRPGRTVTACEAPGVLTQKELDARYPDWQRAIPRQEDAKVVFAESSIEDLRKFVKDNMGKTKSERENRLAVIHATPEADDIQVRIVGKWSGDEIAEARFDLRENPTHYIQQSYDPLLFYYSIQEDFNGEISFTRVDVSPATFKGKQRTSLLMPAQSGTAVSYIDVEDPAAATFEPESDEEYDGDKDSDPLSF